jgi:flagellar L-ring protein precursor FlgH
MKRLTACMLLAIFVVVGGAFAKEKEKKNSGTIQSESLSDYLQRMKQQASPPSVPSTGSLWLDTGRLADVSADYKARHVGDLVTIVVVQDISATNAGSVSSARNFSASSGISALLAQLKTTAVSNLFSPTSASSLTGKGQAATNSSLRTSLAGRVVAVMPTGTMVIEAERQLTMNNERQVVLLRGMVRQGDIGPGDTVASNAIANLSWSLRVRA